MADDEMFELKVGRLTEPPDLDLGRLRSPAEFKDAVERLRDGTPRTKRTVVLQLPDPRPVALKALSIPRAFNYIVQLLGESGLTVTVFVPTAELRALLYKSLPSASDDVVRAVLGRYRLGFTVYELVRARSEAIVNASNPMLQLMGGVSGAIRDAAGPGLQPELDVIAQRRTLRGGDVVVTGAHQLPFARKIIHVATETGTVEVVATAVFNVLSAFDRERLASVALPALCTGTRRLTLEGFADGLRAGCLQYLAEYPSGPLSEVTVCLWTPDDRRRVVERWSALPE